VLLRFIFLVSISFSTWAYGASLALQDYTGVECGETPIFEESSACGPELFQNMESAHCPARYEGVQDARCGVAAYTSAATQRCGVSRYKEGKDKSCPGYVSKDVYRIDATNIACRAGYVVTASQAANPGCPDCNKPRPQPGWVECTRHEIIKSCRKEQFGVEAWKTCAHPDHGVAAWKSCTIHLGYEACRSPNHPVEKYKTCETRKSPNSCQVYLPPSQLSGWMFSNKTTLNFRVKNLVQWVANVQHVEKDVRGLGCLIKRISLESGFAGDVVFDETVLKNMFDYYRAASGKEFDLKDFENDTCSSPLASVKTLICLPEDTSSRCVAIRGYQLARDDLVSLQEDLGFLKTDAIAATRQPSMPEIDSMTKTISDTLSREQESTP